MSVVRTGPDDIESDYFLPAAKVMCPILKLLREPVPSCGIWYSLRLFLFLHTAVPNLFGTRNRFHRATLVAQMVKNLHAMQVTRVQFLGREDSLEKGKATHSSILAWRIPWSEEPGGLQPMGLQRVGYD